MNASLVPSGDHAGRKFWFSAVPRAGVVGARRVAQRLQDDVRIAAAIGRVGERLAVGRPRRRDVERAVDRHPRLVGAVVVGAVDVRDRRDRRPAPSSARRRDRTRTRAWSRATPRRLRCVLWISSAMRCAKTRPPSVTDLQRPAVLLAERHRARRPRSCSRTSTTMPSAVLRTVPTTTPSALSSFQRFERHLIGGRRPRHRSQDVARNQVELFLVVEVVPQHVADRLRGGDDLRLVAERNELGHGDLRRAAAGSPDCR